MNQLNAVKEIIGSKDHTYLFDKVSCIKDLFYKNLEKQPARIIFRERTVSRRTIVNDDNGLVFFFIYIYKATVCS